MVMRTRKIWDGIARKKAVLHFFNRFFRFRGLGKIRTKLVKYQAGLHVNSFNKVYLFEYATGWLTLWLICFQNFLDRSKYESWDEPLKVAGSMPITTDIFVRLSFMYRSVCCMKHNWSIYAVRLKWMSLILARRSFVHPFLSFFLFKPIPVSPLLMWTLFLPAFH